MSKKTTLLWAGWIGLATAIYVLLYLFSPLGKYGIIWITFIALPIYFNGGAKKEEYVHYVISDLCGVAWGVAMLYLIGILVGMGADASVSTGVIVGILTVACCGIHMFVPNSLFANKVPAIFGGISATFSQGGENLMVVAITLILGTTLALICQEGLKLLPKE